VRDFARKGRIQAEYWAHCGGCEWHEPTAPQPHLTPAQEMQERGWKYTSKYGWLCPDCLKELEQETPNNER
jgi:hypothetical protein